MKRGRRIFLLLQLASALVAVLVALVWPRAREEPEYQGKKLSEWLEMFVLDPHPPRHRPG